MLAKSKRLPYKKKMSLTARKCTPLSSIYVDVKGKLRRSVDGYEWFIVMVESSSRHVHTVCMKNKSDAPSIWIEYVAMMENMCNPETIQVMISDRAPELIYGTLERFNRQRGIRMAPTAARSQSNNAPAEAAILWLMNAIRSVLLHARMPSSCWSLALKHVTRTRNMLPNRGSCFAPMSPVQALTGVTPDWSRTKVFGCIGVAHIDKETRNDKSLSPRGTPCRMLAYGPGRTGTCLVLLPGRKMRYVRHVIFFESKFRWEEVTATEKQGAALQLPAAVPTLEMNTLVPDTDSKLAATATNETTDRAEPSLHAATQAHAPTPVPPVPANKSDMYLDMPADMHLDMPDPLPTHTMQNEAKVNLEPPAAEAAEDTPPIQRRSGRDSNPPLRTGQYVVPSWAESARCVADSTVVEETICALTTEAKSPGINVSINERYHNMITRPDRSEWENAMNREWESLLENKTFTVVPRTKQMRVIKSRWTFARKADGRYKARFVACGYSQIHGDSYTSTFAPTARTCTVRALLAYAAHMNMHLFQVDVSSAYLKSPLENVVYVSLPNGRMPKTCRDAGIADVSTARMRYVLRLHKGLYGLKQSGRLWHLHFTKEMKALGYRQLQTDVCVCAKHSSTGEPCIVFATHVDDVIGAHAGTKEARTMLNTDLRHLEKLWGLSCSAGAKEPALLQQKNVAVRNVHENMTYTSSFKELHLGNQIFQNSSFIRISQKRYLELILKRYEKETKGDLKSSRNPGSPLPADFKPSRYEHEEEASESLYRSIIGSCNYLAVWSRPDISHAMGVLGRYLSCPRASHLQAAFHLLRYLRGTADRSLYYWPEGHNNDSKHQPHPHHLIIGGARRRKQERKKPANTQGTKLCGHADSAFASDIDTRRSTTGFIWFYGGNLVSWTSKVQKVVALSTAEAEYIALSQAMQEGACLQNLYTEIGVKKVTPGIAYEDNEACMKIATNEASSVRTKHVAIKFHYCRNMVKRGKMVVTYIGTKNQLADTLTKRTTRDASVRHQWAWGLRSSPGEHWKN